mgnify:CR=1 FL=1
MSTKFVLNETSYFGNGARSELAGEIQKRGFKKVFLVFMNSAFSFCKTNICWHMSSSFVFRG